MIDPETTKPHNGISMGKVDSKILSTKLLFLLISFFIFLVSCGGKHAPTPSTLKNTPPANSPNSGETNSPGDSPSTWKFAQIQQKILRPHCMECHSASGRTGGKRIPFDSREQLLQSDRELVVPGSPEKSGIIQSALLTDEDRMPPPSSNVPPLTAEDIELLKEWIRRGAL